ncbi:JAB domain-containing protein [Clostridium sp.]|uniref:JAB domain-containing protein n=1 Tax=Clostridium sp. TaxID=1506 RepID=UPI003F3DACF1
MNDIRKRVDLVKVKLCKESSFLYSPRKVSSPSDITELIRRTIDESDRENFIVIALNVKNEPQAVEICSTGSLAASIVHPREVFKMAILSNAYSLVLAHNHPSGDITPSKEDINISKRLKECGELIGIKILDHIIMGNERYLSLKEEGYL